MHIPRNILVIAVNGSMGRRRAKILQQLGHEVIGYDIVPYNKIEPVCWYTDMLDEVENFLENPTGDGIKIDAAFISSPPLTKQYYIDICNKYGIVPFCEVDVISYSGKYFPSRSMIYHPAIKKIKELLPMLGRIYTFTYHHGSHIYDWRPNKNYENYYAAKKESSACREMFCFELSWLSWLLGTPISANGFIDKTLDIPDVTADDVYSTVVKLRHSETKELICEAFKGDVNLPYDITGTFQIDMVTRPPVRELTIVGEKGTICWNINLPSVWYENTEGKGTGYEVESGIPESMYVEETKDFIEGQHKYSQEEELQVIKRLKEVESV